nr:MAG TPA: hypothetical protein [Caudoviricetes sp.]
MDFFIKKITIYHRYIEHHIKIKLRRKENEKI